MKVRIKFITATKSGEFKELSGSTEIPFTWTDVQKFGISEDKFQKGNHFEIEATKQGTKWLIVKLASVEKEQQPTQQIAKKDGQNPASVKTEKKQDTVLENTHVVSQNTPMDRNFYLFLNKPHHKEVGNLYTQNKSLPNNLYDKEDPKKQFDKIGLKNKQLGERKLKLETFNFSGIGLGALKDRHIANAKSLLGENNVDASICLKPEWRLALGIGGASVYETSITLHHIYGIPYLPASAVKGIVRSYIIEEMFNDEEDQAILCKEFCDMFGCLKEHEVIKNKNKKKYPSYYKADREGKITFFDAFPTDKINISLDIMNVHYKEYYNSQEKNENGTYKAGTVKPPADWDSPSIINFLTVQQTHFQFLLGSKEESDLRNLKIDNKNIVAWLTAALTQKGIGAKTAVGYGYMEFLNK